MFLGGGGALRAPFSYKVILFVVIIKPGEVSFKAPTGACLTLRLHIEDYF